MDIEEPTEEHGLHESVWQDPICRLFQSENEWQDPICTLFQTKTLATCQADDIEPGGRYSLPTTPPEITPSKVGSGASSRGVNLSNGGCVVHHAAQVKLELREASERAPQEHHPQVKLFQDMGFPLALIQQAVQTHGAQADDSTIVQYILDHWQDTDDARVATCTTQADDSELTLPIKEANATIGTVSGSITEYSGDTACSDSDFDKNYEEAILPTSPSPINWTEETGCDYPIKLCKRELPGGEGHRILMRNHGFAANFVEKAIQELGEGVEYDMLLEYLLYLTAQQDSKASTSGSFEDRASTNDYCYPSKQQASCKEQVNTVEKLVTECGYPAKAVERAIAICDTPLWNAEQDQILDLVDFLTAHGGELNESEDEADVTDSSWLREPIKADPYASSKGKRKYDYGGVARRATINQLSRPERTIGARIGRPQILKEDVAKGAVDRRHGSVGFGLPGCAVQPRYLDEDVKGAPFFYFENVASMQNDEWDRIRRHLFDIEPEFVDSLHFSACRRPRGYIHNLPIEGRRKILADPPMTIQELLPQTKPFWPAWDSRTKLKCITTRMRSDFLIKKIQIGDGTSLQTPEPTPDQQQEILHLCRRWSLVWTAPNIPTPINEVEIEAMLGFDEGHSRNCLSSRSMYKALGNSFSVNTVAFHFSVLKPLYPRGIKVLSLFSGLGGAEVALHKLGIKLLVVVSVEIDDGSRRCLEEWWAASEQTGVLNQTYHNIKDLGRAQISRLVNLYGGFDLIVCGTPCNNLPRGNPLSRLGRDGKQSTVFFEFSRVVAAVRELTIRLHQE